MALDDEQLEILHHLNIFCVNQVQHDMEVIKDPRKTFYKANQEFKLALTALFLSYCLTDNKASRKYTKEYFIDHIFVDSPQNGIKSIHFAEIEEKIVDKALKPQLLYDWMLYRDKNGRGMNALLDEKQLSSKLEDFFQGGDEVYEFARFQRKYHEYCQRKLAKEKESAQEMFRNTLVQQAAAEIAKQQLLAGQNPMEMVNLLFHPQDYDYAIQKMLTDTSPTPLLENKKK